MNVSRNSLFGSHSDVVFFTSSDFSGDPLFGVDGDVYYAPVLPRTLVIEQGATILYSDPDASLEITTTLARMDSSGTCHPTSNGGWHLVRGARTSLPPFAPPYAVVSRAEHLAW